jgi:hypothetical protein
MQLVKASKDESRTDVERKELSRRALEAAGERYSHHGPEGVDYSEPYVDAAFDVLSSPIDGSVDDGAIRLIIFHLRRAPTDSSARVFLLFLTKQAEEEGQASSTCMLLVASLACELNCDEMESKTALGRMASLLQSIDNQVLMEALLIGMIKLAINVKDVPDHIIGTIRKMNESSRSSLVRHRSGQLVQTLSASRIVGKISSGTLLDTMNRIDAHFANVVSTSLSSASSAKETEPRPSRPLSYEPYQGGVRSSSPATSSSTTRQSFSALPAPSTRRDDHARRHRKKQEDGIKEEMHKSIARLTLGEEEDEEPGGVEESHTSEQGDGIVEGNTEHQVLF